MTSDDTGDENLLETIEMRFNLLPGMEPNSIDPDFNMRTKLYEIICKFQELLLKIQSNKNVKPKTRVRRKALVAQPMSDVHLKVANGHILEAIEICLKCMKIDLSNPEPVKLLSFLYNEIGDIENSLKFAFTSAILHKSDPMQWHYLSLAFFNNNDQDRGLECLDKALNKYPKYIPTLWESSCRLYLKRQYPKLISVLFCFFKFTGWRKFTHDIEIFMINISPYLEMELFAIYCTTMVKEHNYTTLCDRMIKLLCLSPNFVKDINNESYDKEIFKGYLQILIYLSPAIITQFTSALCPLYPTETICDYDQIRLQFIKYYVENELWQDAIDICIFVHPKSNCCFYYIVSAVLFYAVAKYESVVPYFMRFYIFLLNIVFFDNFHYDKNLSSQVVEANS
ncbi:hypothetical protein MXB_5216 [Myxobolus squamalis]|nr:hypothetical protein MXB_5216 [Myxobolus squamalis]